MGDWAVGKGWIPLIQDLIKDLETLELAELYHIKEKFAVLRIYATCGSKDPEIQKKFHDRILQAETDSAATCENCGSKENVSANDWNGYWLKTMCLPCGSQIKKI